MLKTPRVTCLGNDMIHHMVIRLCNVLRDSLSNLAYCAGDTGGCGNSSDVVSASSVGDELGSSSPWKKFLKYGGLLLLALFGTCAVW